MLTHEFAKFASRLREVFLHAATSEAAPEHCFNDLALELFRLQAAHNPPYARLCEARGMRPGKVAHWTDIPFVPAASFKDFDFSCLPAVARDRVFHSSGTTQQRPSRHFHNRASLSVYEDSLWPWFARHLLPEQPPSLVLLSLTPSPAEAPHSSLVYMIDTVRSRLAAGPAAFLGHVEAEGWQLQSERILEVLPAAAQGNSPVMLIGTAFNFVQLLDLLESKVGPVRLPPGSRVMETGGYKGRTRSIQKSELHRLIAHRLGIRPEAIVSEYGMSELSSQAYDAVVARRSAECVFLFPPWARALVIAPETGTPAGEGQPGLLRILDLANVCSVAAVQTEDLAIARGAGFELAGRAMLAEPRGCSLMPGAVS